MRITTLIWYYIIEQPNFATL